MADDFYRQLLRDNEMLDKVQAVIRGELDAVRIPVRWTLDPDNAPERMSWCGSYLEAWQQTALRETVAQKYGLPVSWTGDALAHVFGDRMQVDDNGTITNWEELMRQFGTGATRDTAEGKPDYAGFYSALVMKRFGEYMMKHQQLPDGSTRDSDNWKAGIPQEVYVESLMRHVHDILLWDEGYPELAREGAQDALCAIIFNAQGLLHELLKAEQAARNQGAAQCGPPAAGPLRGQGGFVPVSPLGEQLRSARDLGRI